MSAGGREAAAAALTYTQAEIDAMSKEDLLLLYKSTGCQELKWPLVLRYVGLVKSIALQVRGVYSSFAQVSFLWRPSARRSHFPLQRWFTA